MKSTQRRPDEHSSVLGKVVSGRLNPYLCNQTTGYPSREGPQGPKKWPKRQQTPLDAFDLSSGEAGSING